MGAFGRRRMEGPGHDVRGAARVEVARRDGRDVLVDVRSEPPLAVRAAGDRVLLLGSAAAPVGGDELALDVVVGPGARLALGSVAATMAWPSPRGDASSQWVRASVGAGGLLRWVPEPLVLVAGCRHRSTTTVSLAAGAAAWIVEEVALGRRGEPSGDLTMSWRVERDGQPVVHHAERLGPGAPGWGSAVATAGHRHLLAAVGVGAPAPDLAPIVTPDAAVAVLPVAADAWVVLATGTDRIALRRALPSGWEGDLVEREVGAAPGQRVVDAGGDGHGIAGVEGPGDVADAQRRRAPLDEPQHELGVVAGRVER
jgi:urease accessory protein